MGWTAGGVYDLSSSDEDEVEDEVLPTPPPAQTEPIPPAPAPPPANERRLDSSFRQLRSSSSDPKRPWTCSLDDMLQPSETVTHVLLSTFGAATEQLDELRSRHTQKCTPNV